MRTRSSWEATRECCGCAHGGIDFKSESIGASRYYPKQKEYKVEDLILESNLEEPDGLKKMNQG